MAIECLVGRTSSLPDRSRGWPQRPRPRTAAGWRTHRVHPFTDSYFTHDTCVMRWFSGCERYCCVGRVSRRVVGRERRQRRVADQEDVESFDRFSYPPSSCRNTCPSRIRSAGRGGPALFRKSRSGRIALGVVDHDVVRVGRDVLGDRDRQIPEAGAVVLGPGVEAGELAEVIDDRPVASIASASPAPARPR